MCKIGWSVAWSHVLWLGQKQNQYMPRIATQYDQYDFAPALCPWFFSPFPQAWAAIFCMKCSSARRSQPEECRTTDAQSAQWSYNVLYFFHLLSLPMHHWNRFWFAKGGPICPGWPASRFRTWDRLAWSEGGKLGLGPRVSVESVDLSSAVAKSAKCFDAGFLTVLQSLLPSHKSRLSL